MCKYLNTSVLQCRVKSTLGFSFLCLFLWQTVCCAGEKGEIVLRRLRSFGAEGRNIGQLLNPQAVEIDLNGVIYIADSGNNRVQKFDSDGIPLSRTSGWGVSEDRFDQPLDIALDGGLNLFIADYNNNRLVRLDRRLNFVWDAKLNDFGREWEFPLSLAISSWGELFLLEATTSEIVKIDPISQSAEPFGGHRPGGASLAGANRLTIDSEGTIFIANNMQKRIIAYDRYGNYLRSFIAV